MNRSFGLTTWRDQRMDIAGATLRFHFRGKSGKEHLIEVHDRRLARIVRAQTVPNATDLLKVDQAHVKTFLKAEAVESPWRWIQPSRAGST